MQFDATQVDNPGEPSGIIDNNFFSGSSGREGKRYGSQPGRSLRGCTLLIKCLRLGSVHEALENNRAILNAGQCPRRNRKIVPDQVQFRYSDLGRKIQFIWMRDNDIPSIDREHLAGRFLCHVDRLPSRLDVVGPTVPPTSHSSSATPVIQRTVAANDDGSIKDGRIESGVPL